MIRQEKPELLHWLVLQGTLYTQSDALFHTCIHVCLLFVYMLIGRKERMEIEALQATIEKMKLDADEVKKRNKSNVNRLEQLTKTQATQISDLLSQV